MEIAGRALLARVIDRVRLVQPARDIVVATSDRGIDDGIAALATREGVDVFRGATDDVAGRALACVEARGAERFVRVSGDSPFIDPSLIADMLARAEERGADIVTNVFPRSYPPGASVEVVSAAAMRRIVEATDDREDREHVTRYAYRHPEAFVIENVTAPRGRYNGVSLTVDWPRDLERASFIAERCDAGATLDQIVEAAREWEATAGSNDGESAP
jgi:spore coat polysaccharide biosynthesis protein SpsF